MAEYKNAFGPEVQMGGRLITRRLKLNMCRCNVAPGSPGFAIGFSGHCRRLRNGQATTPSPNGPNPTAPRLPFAATIPYNVSGATCCQVYSLLGPGTAMNQLRRLTGLAGMTDQRVFRFRCVHHAVQLVARQSIHLVPLVTASPLLCGLPYAFPIPGVEAMYGIIPLPVRRSGCCIMPSHH